MSATQTPSDRRRKLVPQRPKPLTRSSKQGVWERGYRKHTYWVADKKFGEICLSPAGEGETSYRWSCPKANLRGCSTSLPTARALVENIVHTGAHQLDLFPQDEPATNDQVFESAAEMQG